ncbi:phosphodiester glycosidase family protein [Actinacidiphila reveromycinica]|uniref:phosphodiester glycosidase family protein n=1 Tax=Actinacidiphila reveromycinica TaxID=659352 RepID=UPI00192364DA|nr:phosphodiester glycosidase family protein [Streptomyces sp. SN-593]
MGGRTRARSRFGLRAGGAAVAAFGALAGSLAGASGAAARDGAGLPYSQVEQVAHGVTYGQFTVAGGKGAVTGYLLTVDLSDPRVRVDLLTPGAVAERAPVSRLADTAQAVAAVNGDFFNITDEHPGVTPTGSSDGPEIAGGRALKAAVPDAQRFGPAMPPGGTTRDVLGVGADRRARLDRLTLAGDLRTRQGSHPLGGFNQYALPEGGIGAYTAGWGTVSRERAVCGSDTSRAAACATDTYEVTVRRGRVTAVSDAPGQGAIAPGSTVLVGREAGADALRALRVGDRADVSERLVPAASRVPYAFAVGGFTVLRDGAPLPGLDATTAAVRTAAGFGARGRTLYLLALDGTAAADPGLTVAEVADVMRRAGADDAVNLDGGGSTTLVTRGPGQAAATVRNNPSGVAERPVANAVGVFSTGR